MDDKEMLRDCLRYFKGHKGFHRFFVALRRKWKQLGRSSGVVTLNDASPEEKEALGRFLGTVLTGTVIKIKVRDFEQALSATKFHSLTVENVLEAYFQEQLESNKAARLRCQQERQDFFSRCLSGMDALMAQWLNHALESHRGGYALLQAAYLDDAPGLARILVALNATARLLAQRQQEILRLAVVSAAVSGNPHYFDMNQTAGKLLLAFLSFCQRQEEPKTAEERLELYYSCGLRPDDLSSLTFLYGIHLHDKEGLHPAYEGFISRQEPYAVMLSNLDTLTGASCSRSLVYVVENQTVFSELCRIVPSGIGLMCTSGQVRTASLIVLDMLAVQGCHIFYSGDLDPEGMLIADRLIQRHQDCIEPWHMEPADYMKALSEKNISEERLKMLDRLQDSRLLASADKVRKYKKAAYQERLLEILKKDIQNYGKQLF